MSTHAASSYQSASAVDADALLLSFLQAPDSFVADARLDHLLRHYADPIILAQTRGQGRDAALDILAETRFLLIRRLSRVDAPPIGNFCSYVKTTALNVSCDLGRKGIREKPFSSLTDSDASVIAEQLPDPANVVTSAYRRQLLATLWQEISQLPMRQRLALLLNFRGPDGSCAIKFWKRAGVEHSDLCAALEIAPERFGDLMAQLPMNDATIGERIKATAVEVSTLRLAARKRLQRRTRAWQ